MSHYNVKPVVEIYSSYSGRDLGSIDDEIRRITHDTKKQAPQGGSVAVRRQVETMRAAYSELFPDIGAAGPVNSIPTGHRYGAADAGGTGKLPPGPSQLPAHVTRTGKPGQGAPAGGGGAATGSKAGAASGNVETGGTEGGSH